METKVFNHAGNSYALFKYGKEEWGYPALSLNKVNKDGSLTPLRTKFYKDIPNKGQCIERATFDSFERTAIYPKAREFSIDINNAGKLKGGLNDKGALSFLLNNGQASEEMVGVVERIKSVYSKLSPLSKKYMDIVSKEIKKL